MRFNCPEDGDYKRVRKFLLWPITIGRHTRWLERATIVYRYCDNLDGGWKPFAFVDEDGKRRWENENEICK